MQTIHSMENVKKHVMNMNQYWFDAKTKNTKNACAWMGTFYKEHRRSGNTMRLIRLTGWLWYSPKPFLVVVLFYSGICLTQIFHGYLKSEGKRSLLCIIQNWENQYVAHCCPFIFSFSYPSHSFYYFIYYELIESVMRMSV